MPTLKDPAHTEGAFTPVTVIVDDREKSAVPALLTGTSARGERRPMSPKKEWNQHVSGDPGEVWQRS